MSQDTNDRGQDHGHDDAQDHAQDQARDDAMTTHGSAGPAATGGDHAAFEELGSLLALEVLSDDERARFDAHAEGCGACRERIAADRALHADLRTALADGAPPAHIEEQLIGAFAAGLGAEEILAGDEAATSTLGDDSGFVRGFKTEDELAARRPPRRVRFLAFASAACVFLAIGIFFAVTGTVMMQSASIGEGSGLAGAGPRLSMKGGPVAGGIGAVGRKSGMRSMLRSTGAARTPTAGSGAVHRSVEAEESGMVRFDGASAGPSFADETGSVVHLPPMAREASADPRGRLAKNLRRGLSTVQSLGVVPERDEAVPAPENPFVSPRVAPLSTFGVDVDTASYAIARRELQSGRLPHLSAVRIEEMINAFTYDYPEPVDTDPFSVQVEVTGSPWTPGNRLVRIGLRGRTVDRDRRPPANLVFLVDVSGSMSSADKLPLVQRGLSAMAEALGPRDRVAIVVYAGASGLVLPSTPGTESAVIRSAIAGLRAEGSTNGAAGLELAYLVAGQNFVDGGTNRVIVATDGDFNVGLQSRDGLIGMIMEKAKSGVFLTVLGVGRGNLNDGTLEQIADRGNGHYAYLDSDREAARVLVDELAGTLVTIAKDVKLQVELNPGVVEGYRLIGYENRALAAADFNDDRKDAGEIGAGHTVTALYEIVPTRRGDTGGRPAVDPLRYQDPQLTEDAFSGELLTVKLRYKQPAGDESELRTVSVFDRGGSFDAASTDTRFAAAVAGFGMRLRGSEHVGGATYAGLREIAASAIGRDVDGRRRELTRLLETAERLSR